MLAVQHTAGVQVPLAQHCEFKTVQKAEVPSSPLVGVSIDQDLEGEGSATIT